MCLFARRRSPSLLLLHAVLGLLLGFATGLIFLGVDDNLAGAQNRLGSLFFVVALLGAVSLTAMELVRIGIYVHHVSLAVGH